MYAKHYLDVIQYNAAEATTVNKQIGRQECPQESLFFTQDIINIYTGEIEESDAYACLFERWTGDSRVRHVDLIQENTSGFAQLEELVFRFIATVGHYDY